MTKKKAVILLSGGLDSTTILAIAQSQNFDCYALSFSYGQRHIVELESAKNIAKKMAVKDHKIANIDLRIFGNSALTDEIEVPKNMTIEQLDANKKIPVTYVPARNTIFLSYALAYAETIDAFDIFIGANAVDYSGYPDCRPAFIKAFNDMANLATAKTCDTDNRFNIHAPLIDLTKSQIIAKGLELNVDYSITHSCYDPVMKNSQVFSCGKCDSCLLRLKGFENLNQDDPINYS